MDAEFWVIILSSGVVAAIFSAIISAYFNLYRLKRESEAGFVQARAELYSFLFFWLRIWLTIDIDATPSWSDFASVDKHLSMKLHLVSSKIQKEWLDLHSKVAEREFNDAVTIAIKLVESVKDEFNKDIIPKYEKYVGKNIQKLTS